MNVFELMKLGRVLCECRDPGCGCRGVCDRDSSEIVYRADMQDSDGTAMCEDCCEDALESGVFSTWTAEERRDLEFKDAVTDCENEFEGGPFPGLCGTCPECQSAYGMEPREFYAGVESGDVCDEGGFSWHDCECCGSSLGGDRYAAHAWAKDGKRSIVHMDVCSDCLMYLANGTLPSELG